jgi:hypothetical protein
MDIAKTCLIYLSMDAFACEPDVLTYSSKSSLLHRHPLLPYAIRNWYYHMEEWDERISYIAVPLLQDDLKTALASHALLNEVDYGNGMHIRTFPPASVWLRR